MSCSVLPLGRETRYSFERAADIVQFYIEKEGTESQIMTALTTNLLENPFLTYSNITWYHNGALVDAERVVGAASYQPGGRINVELTIHNITAEDAGVYEGTAFTYPYDVYSIHSTCYSYFDVVDYNLRLYPLQTVYISFTVAFYGEDSWG